MEEIWYLYNTFSLLTHKYGENEMERGIEKVRKIETVNDQQLGQQS